MYYFFGFSYWKHDFVMPFFSEEEQKKICFINPFFQKNLLKLALKKGLDKSSRIYIWGKKSFVDVENFAQRNNIPIYRVEDGFIRSVGLGSDLTQPYSLVIDSRGIYFDPTQESDLEYMLQNKTFSEKELQRAENIRNFLVEHKLSKYNLYANTKLDIPTEKRVVLVPGQVEDDASVRLGTDGMTNLKLLQQARKNAQDAYIIYKPHPDVLVGNRIGNIEESEALKYADRVVTEVGLDSVLELCDEVHTMTSLVGFEALMRNKKVFTYGMPFYAGWGLTYDSISLERRTRELTLLELVAATLLHYPKYINPETLRLCEVEELLETLQKQRSDYNDSLLYRLKLHGRNYVSRKLQLLLRMVMLKR